MKLEGKTAVITGGGSGIGRAVALGFAAEGARIVVADYNEASGAETARLVQERGTEALAVATDVSKSAAVAALFQAVDERGWSPDILVNNAGNSGRMGAIHEVSDEAWDAIVNVHLTGTFYCIREALKRMIPRKQGAIINLGSVAGLRGLPGASSYSAAKGAVASLTKSVSEEVAALGIRVNCIAPGWIDTPILDSLPERLRAKLVQMTPMQRIGAPEEIASVALFLASNDSSYVTGQVISPNGGMYR